MIRPATEADLPFVRSSWLRSYASSDWAALVASGPEHTSTCASCGKRSLKVTRSAAGLSLRNPGDSYWNGQRTLIERLLGQALVLVAEGTEDLLDGFAVLEPPHVLHYVYVRNFPGVRGTGLALELCARLAPPVRYTHRARAIMDERVPAGWSYAPYLLMGVAA